MKNGRYTYALEMTVPLGKRCGELELDIFNQEVVGFLTMFTRKLPILMGSCSGDCITFIGEMKTMMNTIKYSAKGCLTRKEIKLVLNTDQGDYHVVGKQLLAQQRRGISYE